MALRLTKSQHFYFLALITLLVVATKPIIFGSNDLSRFSTIKSLAEEHSFTINHRVTETVDMVRYQGNYYSSKPPALSVFGAGIYWILHNAFNQDLALDYLVDNLSVYVLNLIIVGGSALLLVIFFYKSLKYFDISEKSKIFLSGVLVFATLIFSYLGTMNNHVPSAAFIFASFYYFLKQIKEGQSKGRNFLSGLFLGIAFSIEPVFSAFLIGGLFVFQIVSNKFRRNSIYFILGIAPLVVLYAVFNYTIIQSPLPVYFFKELYHYPGSYWSNPWGTDTLSEPKVVYFLNLLIGNHGLFLYSPILLFVFYGLKRIFFNFQQKDLRRITLAVLTSIIADVLFLGFTTQNYGGSSYGTRWFICFMPLLFFYLAIFFQEIKKRHELAFILLLVFSICFSVLGYLNPWFFNSLEVNGTSYYFPLVAKLVYLKYLFN